MITISKDCLLFEFPDIHPHALAAVRFERTLRIPDDGADYPLPPGLGAFPIHRTADCGRDLPASWNSPHAVMVPMRPSEALWIDFTFCTYPCAIKVATEGANAITGSPVSDRLQPSPQDYVVVPDQRWLDGYLVTKGLVRQFVATQEGRGRSVAEQLMPEPGVNGLKLLFFPMTASHYERHLENCRRATGLPKRMALGAGGKIKQEIYRDRYGIEAWTVSPAARVDVHLVSGRAWRSLTGRRPPSRVPTAKTYLDAGLPWFDYYDPAWAAAAAQPALADIDSLGLVRSDKGVRPPRSSAVRHLGPATRPPKGKHR